MTQSQVLKYTIDLASRDAQSTGEAGIDIETMTYLGTGLFSDGDIVCHLYEVLGGEQ